MSFFFFFNVTATTYIYTLSLHDALPILWRRMNGARTKPERCRIKPRGFGSRFGDVRQKPPRDRKSTRLNSSHSQISYAVFCLKKKKELDHKPSLTLHEKLIQTCFRYELL